MLRILFTLTLLLAIAACSPAPDSSAPAAQSVYDKVSASGTIRCGYVPYPPYFTKDANTGVLGGLMYDVMQEVGKRLNLKIDYTTEVGWGTVIDDLKNHKIDMACSYFWANSNRGRWTEFSQPVVFDRLWLYVRADDSRTWRDYSELNRDDLKASVIDGGAENKIMQIWFPKVRLVSLPELATQGEYYDTVALGKADFLAADENAAGLYMAANPGKLKRLEMPAPVHTFPGVYLLPPNDFRFKNMIDTTLREMDLDGTLTLTLQKYQMADKVGRMVYMK